MNVTLESIRRCFEGALPAQIATCAPDGTPNVAYLSQVHYVDSEHVALSFQFFSKTRENVLANPFAQAQVMEPASGLQYQLALQYLRTETEGPLFEYMKARLAGVASQTGMSKVFKLRGSDVYRVLDIHCTEPAATECGPLPTNRMPALRACSERLAKCWADLASDDLQVSMGPNRLHMGELVATRPFGKVILFEDKSINLQRILRKPAEPAAAGQGEATDAARPAPPPAAENPAATESAEAFPIAIERLKIDSANAEFADLSLPTPFGTRMHSLSGVITGLSTDPATYAQVELDGSVDDYGSARVRGSIQPFRATDFTDIRLTFRNLEMTSLTPYSGKFAGRKIDSGRLSVDLEYKIKQRQLAGENKFVINKLKLGERVDSPDALKLPLDLAIALLQDSNGVIDIDLPISGSLDDPKFSYGKIIWKAIVNVLTKLVTAPFRALGSLLGISSEKLEAIEFDPGSSALLPPEQEKLKSLTEALAKRPALTLTLEPSYDPAADRRALQELAMRREAAAVAGIKLPPGEAPGPVDVNNYKVQTWLEDRYAERAGKAEYQKLRASYQDKEASVAARVMESEMIERLGRRFKTRDTGPASAFHAELLERLTRQTKIEDGELVKLAQARGQAMRDSLLKQGLDPGRVSVASAGTQTAKGKLVPNKMSLGASRAGATSAAPISGPAALPAPAAP